MWHMRDKCYTLFEKVSGDIWLKTCYVHATNMQNGFCRSIPPMCNRACKQSEVQSMPACMGTLRYDIREISVRVESTYCNTQLGIRIAREDDDRMEHSILHSACLRLQPRH